MTRVLIVEHDASGPADRLAGWLTEAGATLDVRVAHAGDPIPEGTSEYDAIVCLGGDMGAYDDDVADWLPATKALLAAALADGTPTLGICLGAQLLAVAGGGRVAVGADGPERGAYLTVKRDAANQDPLFAPLPLTPEVFQYHNDVVAELPPGSTLLLSSTGYPHQAWRQGDAAWATQFHWETSPDAVRSWGATEGVPAQGRLGPIMDTADETMAGVWRGMAQRFLGIAQARSR